MEIEPVNGEQWDRSVATFAIGDELRPAIDEKNVAGAQQAW
jgi:hypothetical protein